MHPVDADRYEKQEDALMDDDIDEQREDVPIDAGIDD